VGFIDRLPHALVAAFRATLEEVASADLLVHVIDAAAPDRDRRIEAVLEVLGEVDAALVPRLDVFNKADILDEDERVRLVERHPQGVVMSALTGDGRTALVDRVVEMLDLATTRVSYWFDVSEESGRLALARVYRHGRVIDQINRGHRIRIDADVPRRLAGQLRQSAGQPGQWAGILGQSGGRRGQPAGPADSDDDPGPENESSHDA
jgi:GTPase